MTMSITTACRSEVSSLDREIAGLCGELREKREPTWASVIDGAYCGGISQESHRNTLAVLRRLVDLSDVPQRLGIMLRAQKLVWALESLVDTVDSPDLQAQAG